MKQNIGSVEDRLAIRELIETYHEAVLINDPELWIDTWCQDGRWNLGEGTEVQGRDAILKHWSDAMAHFDFVGMFGTPTGIRVDDDKATARWYTNEICRKNDGEMLRICGNYHDHYRREADGWRIAAREYRILFMQRPVYEPDEGSHWR